MTQPTVSGSSFQIAQASGSAAPQAPRKVVVTRPADGQSVVIDVRGGAEIDLRGIAADRVVFVQVGDRLVILFENREAVVLQGFYRDGAVAQDLVFQVADGQQVGPQQFASLFPITSDLTILPASGPGSASGGANTAKNVTDPSSIRPAASAMALICSKARMAAKACRRLAAPWTGGQVLRLSRSAS
jgi:hypothetical protein